MDERGRSASLSVPPVLTDALVVKFEGVEISAQSPYAIGDQAGASKRFSVALGGKPTADVIMVLESGDGTEVALSSSRGGGIEAGSAITLEFTPSKWNRPQTFDVVLVDDNRFDTPSMVPIYASTRSNDPAFNSLTWGDGASGEAFGVKGLPVSAGALLLKLDGVPFDSRDTVSLVANANNPRVDARRLDIALSRAPLETVWLKVVGEGDDFALNGSRPESGTTLKFTVKDWDKPMSVVLDAASLAGLLVNNPDRLILTSSSADPHFNDLSVAISINALDVPMNESTSNPVWGGVDPRAVNAIQSTVMSLIDQAVGEALPLVGHLGKDAVTALSKALAPSNLDFTFDQSNNTFKLNIDKSLDLFDLPLASDLAFNIGDPDAPIVVFELDLSLAVPGAMSGTLGPLTVTATDQNAVNPRLRIDQGTGVSGWVDVNLTEDGGEVSGNADGKIRPSEFMAGLASPGSDGNLDFSDVVGNLMPGGSIYNFDVDAAGKAEVNAAFTLDLANSHARKLVNTLLQPIKVLPVVGNAIYWLGTIASDLVATVPKIEFDVGASNEFPIFDTRAGQPVLFA